jgi:hypothetical protein
MGKSVKESIMPKEFIHCRDFGRTVTVISGDSEGGESVETVVPDSDAIKVGWSKEAEHVEIAVCQMVEGVFVEHGFEAILDAGDETDPAKLLQLGRLTPRYIQMDRHGLNRLIRALRQARDDAFGKDA